MSKAKKERSGDKSGKSTKSGAEAERGASQNRCWDCAERASARLEEMFVGIVQRRRIAVGQTPARRAVFLKQHGVAYGSFNPLPDLPEELKTSLFGSGPYPCWVRFSSDTLPTSPDLKTTLGIGIKLFDVPGPKLFGEGDSADFILQNHAVFFVDNAEEMCEFTTAGVVDSDYDAYLARHPQTALILREMAKVEASCLTADYWGVLPFQFGCDEDGHKRYVKYKLEPVDQPAGQPFNDNNYLALDLARRLGQGPARFRFMVQFRTHPKKMPLDEATVAWDSPWIALAELRLPQQDICQRGQADYGENLSFNIWRTPPELEPQGSLAAVRRVVYQGSADQRRVANGISLDEPRHPAPPNRPIPPPEEDRCIVKAAIYPPIGVCRVGNSKHEYFLGPEVANPPPAPPGFYRDKHGALKRQAARFRVYGLNARGEPVAELTADNAEIEWRVHLANQKSSWYEFQLALDIPEAADAPPSLLRNATVGDRAALTIDPGSRHISGRDVHDEKKHCFDSGEFMGKKVYLGELRTDDAGRLIVLGGHGKSASYNDSRAITFANNETWHDDTADGPVHAKVVYQGVELRVDPAWVIVAPPDYAPLQKSVRTMWDVMRDVAVANQMLPRPPRPSFQQDIRPIFERMSNLQWVNAGFAGGFGWQAPFDFSTPEWLARLSDPSPANLEQRRVLKNNFRHYAVDAWSPVPWPWLYGDAMSVPAAHTPRQNSTLSDLQLSFLDQWVSGDFDADYDPAATPPANLDELPVAQQPDMLTRAAMEFCLADAFHPGCEMTWPMRQPGMYMSAFRVKHAPSGWIQPYYGAQLTSDIALQSNGPIAGGQQAGTITRWMAAPWQTDTASCRSGYDSSYDPYLPTFWPARVPNQVMSPAAYAKVMDESLSLEDRRQAFANRADWDEPLGLDKSYTHQINHMIHHFDQMGVVELHPGPADDPAFPAQMQVSEGRYGDAVDEHTAEGGQSSQHCAALTARHDAQPNQREDLRHIEKLCRFPRGLGS